MNDELAAFKKCPVIVLFTYYFVFVRLIYDIIKILFSFVTRFRLYSIILYYLHKI